MGFALRAFCNYFYSQSSVARGHDGGYGVHINLLSDVPRLDDLLLAGYCHQVVSAHLPAIQFYPGADSILLNQTQKLTQNRFLNCLIGDANDVANKLPDRVFKAFNTGHQVRLSMDLLPENLELAHLQQVGQVEQRLNLRLVQHLLAEKALAKDEIGVGKVGKSFQQDLHHNVHLVGHHLIFLLLLHVGVSWVELVELQQGQVGFQVITFLPRLKINIVLQGLDVLRVVSLNPLQHLSNLGPHSLHFNKLLTQELVSCRSESSNK